MEQLEGAPEHRSLLVRATLLRSWFCVHRQARSSRFLRILLNDWQLELNELCPTEVLDAPANLLVLGGLFDQLFPVHQLRHIPATLPLEIMSTVCMSDVPIDLADRLCPDGVN